MAAVFGAFLLLLCVFHHSGANGLNDEIFGDTTKCEDVCTNTYPSHTYEKGAHLGYCKRGCRLFTIIDFANDDKNVNNTRDSCAYSCQEAHQEKDDLDACNLGCDSQRNSIGKQKEKFYQMDALQPPPDIFVPYLYMHSLYSNMVDKFNDRMSVSWSFYMQNNNGNLVVIKSGPHISTDTVSAMLGEDEDILADDYKTSNYIETNLASLDNSITPNVKHSQVHGLDLDGINYNANMQGREDQPQDWLGCIAKKTGLPRLLLSLTIFLSAIVMIWLCFTTAATAPDHKVPSQKLSYYGDLDYLSQLNDHKQPLLANIHPQDKTDAAPLPIKVRVQRI